MTFVDWSKSPPWANWFVEDSDHTRWWFDNRPTWHPKFKRWFPTNEKDRNEMASRDAFEVRPLIQQRGH